MSTSTDLRAAIEEIQDVVAPGDASAVLDRESLGEEYQREALERFARRLGSMPWWVISSITHVLLFLLVALVAVSIKRPSEIEIVEPMQATLVKPPTPPVDERRSIFTWESPDKKVAETEIKAPTVDREKPEDISRAISELDKPMPKGTPEAISDIPLGEQGKFSGVGVGNTGLSGVWGYGRTPVGRKRIISGMPDGGVTESAVEAALAWLARHQESDGSWDPVKYGAEHGTNVRYRVGCTGLALLAFLGHGETETVGRYRDVVRRAQEWLMKQQKPNGGIFEKERGGSSVAAGYNHAIAGLALAEAYGMAGNRQVGEAAQRAVDYSINVHQTAYSGWRYDPKESPDLSVTGWFVMQLKSARMVGLRVDGLGLSGASAFIDKVFDAEGGGSYLPGRKPTSSMTAVGLVCRQFMGGRRDDAALAGAAKRLVRDLPDWKAAGDNGGGGSGDKGMYYWYYGTLGMFQMGRDHGWTEWNATLKPVLVDNQRKGGDEDGSWDPQSWIDQYGGRVFTTAMGALTLEVYYRYPAMLDKK